MENGTNSTSSPPPRRGTFLRGCATGCLIVLVVVALALYGAYRAIRGHYPSLTERLREQGYEVVRGQYLECKDPIESRTVFLGQNVVLHAGSSRGIAILAQTAEIHATVEGNVYFFGQQLIVGSNAELKHNLHVVADRVVKQGQVNGELRGYYREMVTRP
jgi:hypothetical protein